MANKDGGSDRTGVGDGASAVRDDLDRLGRGAAEAASSFYRGAQDAFSERPELGRAADSLRQSVRRNPLVAIGVAFVAGLLLALLTRG